jgi:hypothetical protein
MLTYHRTVRVDAEELRPVPSASSGLELRFSWAAQHRGARPREFLRLLALAFTVGPFALLYGSVDVGSRTTELVIVGQTPAAATIVVNSHSCLDEKALSVAPRHQEQPESRVSSRFVVSKAHTSPSLQSSEQLLVQWHFAGSGAPHGGQQRARCLESSPELGQPRRFSS